MPAPTPNLGRGSYVGFGVEGTWGTAVARTHWFRLVSSNVRRVVEKIKRPVLAEATGSRNRAKHAVGSDKVTGTIEILVGYEGFGPLWKNILQGTPSTSGPSGGLYTHTYPLATGLQIGLTMELIRGTGSAEVFEGVLISKATISIDAGGFMTVSLDIIGETSGGPTSAGSPTLTTNEIEVLHHHAGTLGWNSGTYYPKKLTLTLDNKLADRMLLGSKLTAKPAPSDFLEVTAAVDLEWSADDFDSGWTADTESDLAITFTGTGSRTITFTLHNAYIDDSDHPLTAPGIVMQSAKFVGQSDGTDEGFSVVVANTQSSATAA